VTITARKPEEVAREVEQALRDGCHAFVLKRIDHGGMLDQERLGAARYAAGLQSKVELEVETPAAAAAVR
jgi:L-alanine-DL-glutamate epimerase-like enolase superfamily enzyme